MLTIITPTYNRAHTLPDVYNSLLKQTDKNFLWMVVDDGSSDSTEELVRGWMAENRLCIEYLKKQNGGKASALNVAIDALHTDYAVCLDSDDTFVLDAVEKALKQLDCIKDDSELCGILALRSNPNGTVMCGREIPHSYETLKAEDIFLREHIKAELICFYKSSVLRQYRFPEFEGEKFISPAWMQYEITRRYSYKTSWDSFCVCQYIADGLTKNKRRVIAKNPHGYTCVKCFSFNLAPTLKMKIKHGIMYDCGCIIGKDRNWLKNVKHKVLAVLLLPIAVPVYLKRFKISIK